MDGFIRRLGVKLPLLFVQWEILLPYCDIFHHVLCAWSDKLEYVGWADRVARRLSARERALIVEEDGKRKAIR